MHLWYLSLQVNMQSGETTILLRAEHAPTDLPPPEPPPSPRSTTDALRRFRIARSHGPLAAVNGVAVTNGHRFPGFDFNGRDPKSESPPPAKIKKEEPDAASEDKLAAGPWDLGNKLRRLLELEPRIDGAGLVCDSAAAKSEPESDDDAASAALAAAIMRRAVLVCRAQLYPGLHTILAPPAAAPRPPRAPRTPQTPRTRPPTECAWCLRRYGARRCLWYGPPRLTPPERRVWRRERGRRYLCACCGEAGGAGGAVATSTDDGGWYGKGYRKGRRRRR